MTSECAEKGKQPVFFQKIKHKSIKKMSDTALILAGLFTFLVTFLIVLSTYFEFEKERLSIEENFRQTQKEQAIKSLELLVNIASYRYQQSHRLSQEKIYELLKEDMRFVLPRSDNVIFFIQKQSGEVFYPLDHNASFMLDNTLSITKEYAPMALILGVSVDMHYGEILLAQKKSEYESKIIDFVMKIYLLALFLYLVSTIEYRYVSETMGREICYIIESFKKASHQYEVIDESKFQFKEFKEIAVYANEMIERIHEKNSALVEFNAQLESLVMKKTKELQQSVTFTQDLLQKQDKFIKNAIHEINTPLSIILMNIDLYYLKFEHNPYLLKIEAAVKVLDNIYEDLAYIVKQDSVIYEKSTIHFSRFLQERIAYFEDVAKANKLDIKAQIQEDIFIIFSEIELQRICDNNISNAIKYSYSDQTLFVRLYEQASYAIFEVENQGETIISPEKLFDRYYREDVVRGGFGLGLNIVKEICETNDVRIEVISHNHQTLFRYYFPKA